MRAAPEDLDRHLSFVRDFMENQIPFNRELGIRVADLARGRAVLEIPFRDGLVGDVQRPALHGGVISALMDTAGGAAVWTCIGDRDRCSTIDLRVDYLRPAGLDTVHAEAEVLRVGNRVGVTNIRLFHPADQGTAIAMGKGVYSVKRADE